MLLQRDSRENFGRYGEKWDNSKQKWPNIELFRFASREIWSSVLQSCNNLFIALSKFTSGKLVLATRTWPVQVCGFSTVPPCLEFYQNPM